MRIVQIDNRENSVLSADDAAVHAGALQDGILHGFEITYSGGNIYVSPGRILCGGRVVAVDNIETIQAAIVNRGELIVHIDLAGDEEHSVFFLTRAPKALVQSDTLLSGSIYEVQLATYKTAGNYITELNQTLKKRRVTEHTHGNITDKGGIGTEENLFVMTSSEGKLIAQTDPLVARTAIGLSAFRSYLITKNSNNNSIDFIKSNWGNFPNSSMIIVYVNGTSFGSSDGFMIQKTNDKYGAVLGIGYSMKEPNYWTIDNGIWNK